MAHPHLLQMSEVQPRFSERPTVPDAGTELEDRWAKESTITYEGGYIKSAYGNLVQTWNLSALPTTCTSIDVDRKGYTVDRELTIGMGSKSITYAPKTYKRYPRRNGGGAAGGDAMTFVTDVGQYTARVSGDIQTLISWVCENKNVQFGTLEIYTNRGAFYGPFGLSLESD